MGKSTTWDKVAARAKAPPEEGKAPGAEEEIRRLNEELEERARKRTAQLEAANEALRESEVKHRVLFESSRDAIMMLAPPSWKFTEANPATLQMFGAGAKADFLAVEPWQVSPDRQPDGRASEEKARDMIETAMRDGSHFFEWMHKRLNGEDFPATVLLTRMQLAEQTLLQATVRDITEYKKATEALRLSEERYRRLVDGIDLGIALIGTDHRVIMANVALAKMFNASSDALGGKSCSEVLERHQGACPGCAGTVAMETRLPQETEREGIRDDGSSFQVRIRAIPIVGEDGSVSGFIEVVEDITERRFLEEQLAQAQRLEAIGRLAAGIAHEINTPTQYVGDNTRFLQESFAAMLPLWEKYERLTAAVRTGSVPPELLAEIEAAANQADVPYIKQEIPKAIQQSQDGLARVTKIVRAMKEFSHPGEQQRTPTNVNHAIQTTIDVCRSEWKYVAETVTDFDPDLPSVPCFPADLNQVILNLIVNAAHAIADVVGDGAKGKGTITISTRRVEGWAEIRVADTGTGIAQENRSKIFQPFFTTKGVGKGTGQGLAMARIAVVKKHGGTIEFETEVGRGTTFVIRLPVGPNPS